MFTPYCFIVYTSPRILGYVRDIKLSSHLNWVMLFEMFSEMDLLSPQVLNIILKVVPCNSTDHRPRQTERGNFITTRNIKWNVTQQPGSGSTYLPLPKFTEENKVYLNTFRRFCWDMNLIKPTERKTHLPI